MFRIGKGVALTTVSTNTKTEDIFIFLPHCIIIVIFNFFISFFAAQMTQFWPLTSKVNKKKQKSRWLLWPDVIFFWAVLLSLYYIGFSCANLSRKWIISWVNMFELIFNMVAKSWYQPKILPLQIIFWFIIENWLNWNLSISLRTLSVVFLPT